MKKNTYYIVDGNSFIYRAFFAVPRFTTRDGVVINALFGFTKMLLKLLKQTDAAHVIVAFDTGKESFRTALYKEYKAHREAMPDDLVTQIPLIHELVALMQLPTLAIPGVEADDAIATFVTMHPDHTHYIVTGDKDMMQLVDDNVFIYDTMKDKTYDAHGVQEKMGVPPEKITDLLGLMGDSSDNIPGVKGIGPKTAVKLLAEYHTIEELLEHTDDIAGSVGKKLAECREIALLSKTLATVRTDIDLSHITLDAPLPEGKEIWTFCTQFEFFSLKKDIEEIFGLEENKAPLQTSTTKKAAAHKKVEPDSALLKKWLAHPVTAIHHPEYVLIATDTEYMLVPFHQKQYAEELISWLEHDPKGTVFGLKELSFLLHGPDDAKTQLDIFSLS